MSKIYDFKNKDIKIEFNSIKIGNSAYINQPIGVIEYIEYLQNQLQQKENIIKEVREYIEEHIKYECDDAFNGKQFYSYHLYDFDKKELLGILEKGSDE